LQNLKLDLAVAEEEPAKMPVDTVGVIMQTETVRSFSGNSWRHSLRIISGPQVRLELALLKTKCQRLLNFLN